MANLLSSTVSDALIRTPTGPRAAGPGDVAPTGEGGAGTAPDWNGEGRTTPAPDPSAPEPEATQRLRARYAEISQVAGRLAHEIRNPLSTVSLNLDLLAEDFQDAETPRDRRALQRVERVRHEIHRLYGVLENFLRFARIQDLKLELVDLNAVVEELGDFYEPHAATQAIVMRTQFAPDLPPIRLDVDLFKQALLNLVLNAEHAMPSGGDLILTTRREGNRIVLEVTDTGMGMTDEVRGRIFEAFFSTRSGGSGLGLPTTRKIVEAHGGTIHVRSEPGKGSQFTIRLPVAAGPSPPAGEPAPQNGPSSPRPSPMG